MRGDIAGMVRGKYHRSWRILSTMTRRDQEGGRQRAGRETNRETGNYVPLDWARAREPGESRDLGRGRGLFIGHSSESGHGGSGLRLGPKKIGNKVRSRGKLETSSGPEVPYKIKLELKNKFGFWFDFLELSHAAVLNNFTQANEVGLTFN